MKSYIQYDEQGAIVSTMRITDECYRANEGLMKLIEGEAIPGRHYVKGGQIIDRPEQDTEFGNLKLTKLPVPCKIMINDETYDCEDETAELEFDLPVTYKIIVSAFPYLDAEFTYENQA